MTLKTIECLEGMLARFRVEESGAARMDRAVLVFGLVALTALLVISMMGRESPGSLARTEGTPSAAGSAAATGPATPERRMVSAVGRPAAGPTVAEGEPLPSSMATPGFIDHVDPPPLPDNEAAILAAESARVRAREDAARAAAEAAPAGQASEARGPATSDGS